MMDFNRKVNLMLCYLLFLSILWRREATNVPRRHSITSRTSHFLVNRIWCPIFFVILLRARYAQDKEVQFTVSQSGY